MDFDPNLFSLPPARRGLRGHPFKVLQRASHRRRIGSPFSVRVVKYRNKLPASVVTASSLFKFFQEMVEESLDSSLSPSLPLITHLLVSLFPFPHPTGTPLINSYHLYMLPKSLLYIYLVSSGPLWPTFYHYKSFNRIYRWPE